jgi:uncharacterized membrane protein
VNTTGEWIRKGSQTDKAPFNCSIQVSDYTYSDINDNYSFKFELNDTYNYLNTSIANATIEKDDTNLTINVSDVGVIRGQTIVFTGVLMDTDNGTLMEGFTVRLRNHSSSVVNTSITGENGTYTLYYTIPSDMSFGLHNFSVTFDGDNNYFASTSSNVTLEVLGRPLIEDSGYYTSDSVSPRGWGETWYFLVNVTADPAAPNVTVTLQYNRSGSWVDINSTYCIDCTSETQLIIVANWSGDDADNIRYYRFYANDSNGNVNVTEPRNVTVERDDIYIYMTSTPPTVIRLGGGTLTARFRDNDRGSIGIPGVEAKMKFSEHGQGSGITVERNCTTTNDGWCIINYAPDCNTEVGYQDWIAELNHSYYKYASKSGAIHVKGKLVLNITNPTDGAIFHQGDMGYLNATVWDECNNSVTGLTVVWENSTSDLKNNDGSPVEGENTSWVVPTTYDQGPSWLIADIDVALTENYWGSEPSNVSILVYGKAKLSDEPLRTFPDGIMAGNIIKDITCRVKDIIKDEYVKGYNVEFFNNGVSTANATTKDYGLGDIKAVWSWNLSNESHGLHNITCRIGDSDALYYTATSPTEISDMVFINRPLIISDISVKPTDKTINRNDSFSPYEANITVHVRDADIDPDKTGVIVTFYNESLGKIGECITDSFGECSYSYNPEDTVKPGEYNIYMNATIDDPRIAPSETNVTTITVKGRLWVNITSPIEGEKYTKYEEIYLNATVLTENGVDVTSDPLLTLVWRNDTGEIAVGNNIRWSTLPEQETGERLINATATMDYYDTDSDIIYIIIAGEAKAKMESPEYSALGDLLTISCAALDAQYNTSIPNYTVEIWQRKKDEAWEFLTRNKTDSTGYLEFTYDPSYRGEIEYRCNISDEMNYTVNASRGDNESFSWTTILDLRPPRIEDVSILPNESMEAYQQVSIKANITDDDPGCWVRAWYEVTLDGSTNASTEVTVGKGGGLYEATYTPVKGGNYTIKIRAKDCEEPPNPDPSRDYSSINYTYVYIGYIYVWGTAKGVISQTPLDVTLEEVYYNEGDTFELTLNFTNLGNGTAREVNLTFTDTDSQIDVAYSPSGSKECGDISAGESCVLAVNATVPAGTTARVFYINGKAVWMNPDRTINETGLNTTVTVAYNWVLQFNESEFHITAPHDTTSQKYITISSIGNSNVNSIDLTVSDGDQDNMSSLCPDCTVRIENQQIYHISTLPYGTNESLRITVNVPAHQPPGTYSSRLRAASPNTGELVIPFYVEVPGNASWIVDPLDLGNVSSFRPWTGENTGSLGNITITNLGNVNITFAANTPTESEMGGTRIRAIPGDIPFKVLPGASVTVETEYTIFNTSLNGTYCDVIRFDVFDSSPVPTEEADPPSRSIPFCLDVLLPAVNWAHSPSVISREVVHNTSGDFGVVVVENTGNIGLNLTTLLNATYIGKNVSDFFIDIGRTVTIGLNYSVPRVSNPTSFTSYLVTTNGEENRSTLLNLTVHPFDFGIVWPTTEDNAWNVSAGDTLSIRVNATYAGEAIQDGINFTVAMSNGTETVYPSIQGSFENGLWILNITIPELGDPADPERTADLNITANYTRIGLALSDFEESSIIYRDEVGPIVFLSVTPPIASSNQTLTGMAMMYDRGVVVNVSGAVIYPNGSIYNISFSEPVSYGSGLYLSSANIVMKTSYPRGIYYLTAMAWDKSGNTGSGITSFGFYPPEEPTPVYVDLNYTLFLNQTVENRIINYTFTRGWVIPPEFNETEIDVENSTIMVVDSNDTIIIEDVNHNALVNISRALNLSLPLLYASKFLDANITVGGENTTIYAQMAKSLPLINASIVSITNVTVKSEDLYKYVGDIYYNFTGINYSGDFSELKGYKCEALSEDWTCASWRKTPIIERSREGRYIVVSIDRFSYPALVTGTEKEDITPPGITLLGDLDAGETCDQKPVFEGIANDSQSNVVSVVYKLEGGNWTNATPKDGSFDSQSEKFEIAINETLEYGKKYTIIINATDEKGNQGSTEEKEFWVKYCGTPPSIPPAGGGGGGGGGGGPTVNLTPITQTLNKLIAETLGAPKVAPFTVETNLVEVELRPGEEKFYSIWITNNLKKSQIANLSISGRAAKFIEFYWRGTRIDGRMGIPLDLESTEHVTVRVYALPTAQLGAYTADITIKINGKTHTIPVTVRIVAEKEPLMDVRVEAVTKDVKLGTAVKFHVALYNLGARKRFDVQLIHRIKEIETDRIVYQFEEAVALETSLSLLRAISLADVNITAGKYFIETEARYENKTASAADVFNVFKPFWTRTKKLIALTVFLLVVTSAVGYRGRQWYIARKQARLRYLHAAQYRNLPKGPMWIGKIAETNIRAEFDPNDLKTHMIIAGATGSGKSVAASVIVEELLDLNIPVIVFDPTAQWTGFVRPCKDENFFKVYPKFGMKREDAKPYRGLIFEVTDPNVKIDFKKFMNPGEITIFTLDKLKPGEYDQAVMNIIDTIFEMGWEESIDLKMAIVFDEIHRLHEKYGGKGGYIALEKGAREFRKWGIGLIMVSQVLADFKEELKGNVLTEMQLHTKSLSDVQRVKEKYGEEYAKRLTKLEVGVGLMQNPKYNDGKPFFVNIRPVKHEAHKIPDRDLETYKEFDSILSMVESTIESLKASGVDTFDLELEFKLARDKLKEGRFRMAEIYTESLLESLKKYEKR